ncbi:MAG: hypothetical protein WC374_01125 [Phycisphaerae bacterium]|jgi:hypothetical protein
MITDPKKIERAKFLPSGPMVATKHNLRERLKFMTYDDMRLLLAALECSLEELLDKAWAYCSGKEGISLKINYP